MIPLISIQAKKRFLNWFLAHYKLSRENTWLIKFLLRHDSILKNVHFITDVLQYPKGIMITSYCSDDLDFRFHKQHVFTKNIEKLFHDLRFHPNERLYVQLNFRQQGNQFYTSLLEDQFFAHDNKQVKQTDQSRAEQLLQKIVHDKAKEDFNKQIDDALDRKDKSRFIALTKPSPHVMNRY